LHVGLHYNAISRHHRWYRIADCKRERVVPRGDNSHDTERNAALDHSHETRKCAESSAWPKEPSGISGVVPSGDAHVEDFFIRVFPGLARLSLQQIQNGLTIVQQRIVKSQHDRAAHRNGGICPHPLGPAGLVENGIDVVLGACRERVQGGAGERLDDVGRLPRGKQRRKKSIRIHNGPYELTTMSTR
jgi:hypothetical protein